MNAVRADAQPRSLTVATPAALCPPARQREFTRACARYDASPLACEQRRLSVKAESRRRKGGWSSCWHLHGRCRTLLDWQELRSLGPLMARFDTSGCDRANIGLPSDMPSPSRFLHDLAARCGVMSGWSPIVNCSRAVTHHPCGADSQAKALGCRSMSLADGRNQCYMREPPRLQGASPQTTLSVTSLSKARICGSKPCDEITEAILRTYLMQWSDNATSTCRDSNVSAKDAKRNILVLVDTPCNGCSSTPSGQSNLWHRMARMFTVWQALKAVGCARSGGDCRIAPLPNADILFTSRHSHESIPRSSSSGWRSLVGGKIRRIAIRGDADAGSAISLVSASWCQYDKLLLIPYSPRLVWGGKLFDPDRWSNADTLWSLAYGRHLPCVGSETGHVWRTFVREMLERMRLKHMMWPSYMLQPTEQLDNERSTQVCLLLRTDPTKKPGEVKSWIKQETRVPRIESPGSVADIHRVLSTVCHGRTKLRVRNVFFVSNSSLSHHASQMAGCNVAMGIHGAQLMNAMWMEAGSSVVEFHRLPPVHADSSQSATSYYYRNVAILSGHTYFSRQICDKEKCDRHLDGPSNCQSSRERVFSHCDGQAEQDGIHFDLERVRQVAIAAVAAVGHSGGLYDDRPVVTCRGQDGA